MQNIDHLTDEELRERLLKMSPEAAAQYRNLNAESVSLLEINLREMDLYELEDITDA